MNPGERRFIGGRLACSPVSNSVVIAPRVAVECLEPGKVLRFARCHGNDEAVFRPGSATVQAIDKMSGEVTFEMALNCIIPGAAEGDAVFEEEPPCTRCECKRCQRDRAK